MPSQIKLLIERKTRVPTKNQIVHQFRSDWKKVHMIDYYTSKQMFSNIGNGPIESDAQFCKWLLDNFGTGVYLVIAWRKGRKGFWNFMKVELFEDKFRRLPKNPTPEEQEINQEKRYIENLKRKKIDKSQSEREEIESEIEDTEDYLSDIRKEIKNSKKGCYPYLKSCQPVYHWHSYEDYNVQQKEEEFIGRMF